MKWSIVLLNEEDGWCHYPICCPIVYYTSNNGYICAPNKIVEKTTCEMVQTDEIISPWRMVCDIQTPQVLRSALQIMSFYQQSALSLYDYPLC